MANDQKQEYLDLLSMSGVRDVLDWRIPNDDDAINDAQKHEQFKADADAYVELFSSAVDAISSGDKKS